MSEKSAQPIVVTHVISGDLWAGAEVQVYNLCKALLYSGDVRPTAVVFNDGVLSTRLRELGIQVDVANEKQFGPLKIILAIKHHCEKQKSQVVHTHGFKENILGILAKDLAKVPCSVRTVHGNPESNFPLKQLHKRVIHRLDIMLGQLRQRHVIAVSTQLEVQLNHLFPGKVTKIFNFIDVEMIRRERIKSTAPGVAPVKIGIVGRLVPVKRVDIFLDTIALLKERGVDCSGVVIGTGPLETTLKDYARTLGIEESVEFKGFVDPVIDELCKIDILLMTSNHEGLPMTLLEALALEIPVIAHSVGGIPEILDHGQCGWLVQQNSAAHYADTIRSVTSSEVKQSSKTFAGLQHVHRLFDNHENVKAYATLYRPELA